jgi:hypothetical protein
MPLLLISYDIDFVCVINEPENKMQFEAPVGFQKETYCYRCSRFESEISRLRIVKPVRVCQGCYGALKTQHHPGDSAGT